MAPVMITNNKFTAAAVDILFVGSNDILSTCNVNDNLAEGGGGTFINRGSGSGAIDATYNVYGPGGAFGPNETKNPDPGKTANAAITGSGAAGVTYSPWRGCSIDAVPTTLTDATIIGAGYQPTGTPMSAQTVGANPKPRLCRSHLKLNLYRRCGRDLVQLVRPQ